MADLSLVSEMPVGATVTFGLALALCCLLAFHALVLPGRVRTKATPLSFGGRRPQRFSRNGKEDF